MTLLNFNLWKHIKSSIFETPVEYELHHVSRINVALRQFSERV